MLHCSGKISFFALGASLQVELYACWHCGLGRSHTGDDFLRWYKHGEAPRKAVFSHPAAWRTCRRRGGIRHAVKRERMQRRLPFLLVAYFRVRKPGLDNDLVRKSLINMKIFSF